MNKSLWVIFFAIALITHLAGILIPNSVIQIVSKPLIVITLAGYFITATRGTGEGSKIWILSALFFSWVGDVVLLFQGNESFFFLAGLSSFLLAHTFYIIFFHRARIREAIKGRWWPWLIVAVYYTILMIVLGDHTADMKWPVRIYGVIISMMVGLAIHMRFMAYKKAGLLLMLGAVLFVISDSVLAIDKFYQPFEAAGLIIMATYGVAQFFITAGAALYLSSAHKE